jgi:hypothetical protein
MATVAFPQQIASAYVVFFGVYGDVTRRAQECDVSRQAIYRQAAATAAALTETTHRQQVDNLRALLRQEQSRVLELERDLAKAVVLTTERQGHFAAVAMAKGVSLPVAHVLLEVLKPGQALSVGHLGRHTKEACQRAGTLLSVLDEFTHALARQASLDEIYVKAPVLMVVEPESMCWLTGQLTVSVSGEAWAATLATFPALEQVTRDAGSALSKGVAQCQAQRQQQQASAVTDQLDHFHTLREGNRALRQGEARLRRAFDKAEQAQRQLDAQRRRGESVAGSATQVGLLWQRAEHEMDQAQVRERAWRQTQAALRLFTPQGELNTRAQAEAVLAETLPQLSDIAFAKTRRLLQRPETLTYLDEVARKLEALPGTYGRETGGGA